MDEWNTLPEGSAKVPFTEDQLERLVDAKRRDSEQNAAFSKQACAKERSNVEARLASLIQTNWRGGTALTGDGLAFIST